MQRRSVLHNLLDWSFGEFVTTRVLRPLYAVWLVLWTLGSALCLVGALVTCFSAPFPSGTGRLLTVLAALIVVPLVWFLALAATRIACELIIVLFRIERNTAAPTAAPTPAPPAPGARARAPEPTPGAPFGPSSSTGRYEIG